MINQKQTKLLEKTGGIIRGKTKTITIFSYFRDIGIMNDNGSLVICGRIKEMVIRGGENVYPVELEEQIFKHYDIKSVYVSY